MKIAICFGTRPEIIKLYLLSQKMSEKFSVINVFTGQHHSLYNDVKHLIQNIHYHLDTKEYSHVSLLYSDLMKNMYDCFNKEKPDLIVVQGDTASAYAAAMCGFLMGIKVGHVEAGLRTFDICSPFPEEFNRQVISKISHYNWCPTKLSHEILVNEKVCGLKILTGNTIVDAVNDISKKIEDIPNNRILITLHRRENRDAFKYILEQINDVSKKHSEFEFIFPAHPNPIIREALSSFGFNNVKIVDPMPYEKFIGEIKNCVGIITDSGGIQEEAVCLKKKVLICRTNTERSEGVSVGVCKLIGNEVVKNFDWLLKKEEFNFENPYGDGNSCKKIIETLI